MEKKLLIEQICDEVNEMKVLIKFLQEENHKLKMENEKLKGDLKQIDNKDSSGVRSNKVVKSNLFKRR